MKIVEIFGENRLEFIEKSKIIEIWWMISIVDVNVSKLPAKPCAFGPRMKRNLKIFKKILRFFWTKPLWKIEFFTIFTKYFLDFWLRSENIDLLMITPDFYNNFSGFGGGGNVPAFPPPPTLPMPLDLDVGSPCPGS